MRNIKAIKHLYGSFFLFFFYSIAIWAQKNTDYTSVIRSRFDNEMAQTYPEKAYVQTDKPYYNAGDTIWLKGYVVNAINNVPNTLSRYLYVELINMSDSVVSRIKIRKDSVGFSGYIKLHSDMKTGNYSLRAYTFWMQNLGNDFFFSKKIYIGNALINNLLDKITYGNAENGEVPVTLTFLNNPSNPIAGKRVNITLPNNKNIFFKVNEEGKIHWKMAVDTTSGKKKSMDVSIVGENLNYHTRVYLPEFSTDFDVQFFPESGVLLSDMSQVIAFKAIGKDGLSVNVSGEIFNSKGEKITEISTLNAGMGRFSLVPSAGEHFYAVVRTESGLEKRFELPDAKTAGINLQLGNSNGNIIYEVRNTTQIPNSALYLLVHSRGYFCTMQSLKKSVGRILQSSLPSGVTSFSVVDSLGNTYCERLFFVKNINIPIISMSMDKDFYKKRENIHLKFNVLSSAKNPVFGAFSVAVTDSHVVKQDSLANNILSYLLLGSDIKGYIENPGRYFDKDNKFASQEIDNLMLTQGWRRFNTSDVVKGKLTPVNYYIELGQTLSGKALGIFNKPAKDCNIYVLSTQKKLFRYAKTDKDGRYLIDGIEFPDSTEFLLKAKNKSKFTDVELIPDPDLFPKPSACLPFRVNENKTISDDFWDLSKQKFYFENGMKVINLGEVVVNAKKTDDNDEYYSAMADQEIEVSQLKNYENMNILSIISRFAGVQVIDGDVFIRGSKKSPIILVDGVEIEDIGEIQSLTGDDIENVSLFKGSGAAIFGNKGDNGVIAVTLKKGKELKASRPVSVCQIKPLGYQKPAQFYVPKYEVDSVRLNEKPDLRSTVYWNPELKTDKDGNFEMNFYSADNANDYTVILEGITDEGEICRLVGVIKRKD